MPTRKAPTASIFVSPELWYQHYHQKSGVISKRVNIGLDTEKENIDAGQLSEVSIIRKQPKYLGGAFQPSNATGTTWFMKRDTSDPFHKIGNTPQGYSVIQEQTLLEDYVMEATFAELMRALDPHHPKARVVMQKDKIHLMSKAIPGFCPLADVVKNKHPRIRNGEAFKQGVKNGKIDGFAKSMVMKLWIGDRDWHPGNAGLRTNEDGSYSVVSIDHGQSLGYLLTRGHGNIDYSVSPQDWKGLPYRQPHQVINHLDQIKHQMLTPYHKAGRLTRDTQLLDTEMATNPNFLNEKNATLLSIALLPEGVIHKHCFACIANPQQAEQVFQGLLQRRAMMLDAAFSCDTSFARYLTSPAAQTVLQQTVNNLKAFKLAGSTALIDPTYHVQLQQETNQLFENLKTIARQQLPVQPPTHHQTRYVSQDLGPVFAQIGQQLNIVGQKAVLHSRGVIQTKPLKQQPQFTPPPPRDAQPQRKQPLYHPRRG